MSKKKYNTLETHVTLNKIRRRVDADRFVFDDFINACPYTLEQIQSRNKKGNITTWRHVSAVWLMLQGHTLTDTGKRMNRDHCTIRHSLKVVLSSFEVSGYSKITDAIQEVCAKSRDPYTARVPFDQYAELIRLHLGNSDEVETLITETYANLPTIQKM